MGRHSAAEDDAPDEAAAGESGGATAVAVVTAPGRRGRHARPDESTAPEPEPELEPEGDADDDGGLTAELLTTFGGGQEPAAAEEAAPVTPELHAPAVPTAPQEPTTSTPAGAAARRSGGTRSDLRLLRRHGDVRARVIAGVVLPFAVFTVVMAVLDRLDRSYLIWIWIPLVTAGVLGGMFLDHGHRRYSVSDGQASQTAARR